MTENEKIVNKYILGQDLTPLHGFVMFPRAIVMFSDGARLPIKHIPEWMLPMLELVTQESEEPRRYRVINP